jgi:hypothetical protein
VDRPDFLAWAAAVGGPNPEDFQCASAPRPIKSDVPLSEAARFLESHREHVKTATSPDGRWFFAWTVLEQPDQYLFLWNRTGRDEVERVDTLGSGGQYHWAIWFANDACAVLGVESCWTRQGKAIPCPFVDVYLVRQGVTVSYSAMPRY